MTNIFSASCWFVGERRTLLCLSPKMVTKKHRYNNFYFYQILPNLAEALHLAVGIVDAAMFINDLGQEISSRWPRGWGSSGRVKVSGKNKSVWVLYIFRVFHRRNIPGTPGKDYPIFSTNILCKINPTMAHCRNKGSGGQNQRRKNGNGQNRKNGQNQNQNAQAPRAQRNRQQAQPTRKK